MLIDICLAHLNVLSVNQNFVLKMLLSLVLSGELYHSNIFNLNSHFDESAQKPMW